MAKVTLTIEGTAEEVMDSLQELVGLQKGKRTSVSWLPNEINEFFHSLQPEAQRILREIATRPDGYDRNDLVSRLSISERGLAGRLSSVGHTLRRFFPMKPKPVELDWGTWKYIMLPEVAEWISSELH